ncbi:rho GTPase-activating protein 20-like [Erinaceus europaeus]|uniref:Rho GTPase-activating protein 20-like n=1 Tax=Erinaceus europaeus TaxID=9365 RepID=A0ABM3WT85_ERIEU|nr:rho GTPase-activating protein 20-like [Erinaceus europaeus]
MCSRRSSEDSATSEGEDAWEGPCGRLLLATTAKVKRGLRRQARQLHLYSNVLLISSSKFESNFTIKHSVPLRSLWVSAYLERSRRATSRDRRSLTVGWSRNSFVVTFS